MGVGFAVLCSRCLGFAEGFGHRGLSGLGLLIRIDGFLSGRARKARGSDCFEVADLLHGSWKHSCIFLSGTM